MPSPNLFDGREQMFNFMRKTKPNEVAELVKSFEQGKEFTPDYPFLLTRNYQFFFITDDMMTGHRANGLLQDPSQSFKLWAGYTQRPFVMAKKVLGKATYPMLFDPTGQPNTKGRIGMALAGKPAPIRGEVWAIRPRLILDLDTHRLNTVECNRQRVALSIPIQANTQAFKEFNHYGVPLYYDHKFTYVERSIRAWTYIGDYDYWYYQNPDLIRSVDPHEPNNPDNKPYYYFTQLEANDFK